MEFLEALEAQCTKDAEMHRAMLESPNENVGTRAAINESTRDAMKELATHFIVLHEVSHVLCGHLDAVQKTGPAKALAFDESSLGIDSPTKEDGGPFPSATDIHRAYFLEMEADNTAIQWLMQAPVLENLGRSLRLQLPDEYVEEHSIAMVDLGGKARVQAFRVLLSACWSVIALMEKRRGRALTRPGGHPTSEARLVAAVFTLMEQFAELTDGFTDPATGGKFRRLTSLHQEACTEFLDQIVKPAFIEYVAAQYRQSDPTERHIDALAVLQAVKKSVADDPPDSRLGDEIQAIEKLRPCMVHDLKIFRYFYNEKI
ncbi:hypothetical protein [Caballeronia novacaledonica]|uniref:Uncharacterized protein n=1 Tax=Caballeronia novacaledonica TaxID=1544861 RepID=A0AA37ICR7_9BURK|nr:hypothetical protein [Caballeronia novacaledonica]GJH26978.1 hypothetical protein CBA19CS42_20700 [Caballeronia novacaledonica]